MSLSDKDRPLVTYYCQRLEQSIGMRKISARTLVELRYFIERDEVSGPDAAKRNVDFSTRLLAATITDPQQTVDEWADLSTETLDELTEQALIVNGMTDDAKKN